MAFLDELRDHERADVSARDDARRACVGEWLCRRPDALFRELREHAPTLVVGRMAFVTRYDDVVDVLGRGDAFSVQPYAEAITGINRGSNFLLGMDEGPEYDTQASLLRGVFRREDASRVRDTVAAHCAEVLASARADGRLDIVGQFGRLVPARIVGDYVGVPGPDPLTLARWARAIFTDGFVNVLRLPLLTRRALRESRAFRAYLDALIVERRAARAAGLAPRDDVLGRLLAQVCASGPGRDEGAALTRDVLLWTTAGTIDNVCTAVARAMDYLLDHPEQLAGARNAAASGDDALLRTYLFEALRFCPPTPVVTRRCVRDHTLSPGTPHETHLPEGMLTFVGLGAAMMDASSVERPEAFALDRPASHYLHFGVGLHACLGRHLAEAHLVAMSRALLLLPSVRRAPGLAGRLRSDGVFPRSLVVRFDGGRPRV